MSVRLVTEPSTVSATIGALVVHSDVVENAPVLQLLVGSLPLGMNGLSLESKLLLLDVCVKTTFWPGASVMFSAPQML